MKNLVITGIGVVTPLGNNIKTTWQNLTKGFSGIGKITKFDSYGSALPSRIAGELKNFLPQDYIPQKDILRLDPFIQYAAAASFMAFEDSGLELDASEVLRTGVIIGSSRGGITTMEKAMEQHFLKGKPFSAYLMSSSTINMASSYISMRLGIKGHVLGISTACASGTSAIGEAARLIRGGEIDLALAGGTEAPICKLAVGGYGSAGALSKKNDEPEKASRPFDRDRDGFVIAEGAGVLVLEELKHALKRGARIYAELAGYGTSSDAFHQTKPESTGEALAIERALKDACVSVDEVEYINAHATSTVLGDITETQAIKKVFGKRAYKIPTSSSKSMLGHMLGGAGAVEAALTALSISKETIIPTINLDNQDVDCNLNHVNSLTDKKIHSAISNSFGFGGVNAVLVLKKIKS
ncbi:MAG: beta-ketoacyl-ACP synthase II [Thermodesulfovibrionia bacterium]|nr:beta-ketoacyl-ACP synthase II [Thermodesulfovibrionia bacterium]